MQIMLDTTTYEHPAALRALAKFIEAIAAIEDATPAAVSASGIVEIKDTKAAAEFFGTDGKADTVARETATILDFKTSDSLPPDHFEKTGTAAPPVIPPPSAGLYTSSGTTAAIPLPPVPVPVPVPVPPSALPPIPKPPGEAPAPLFDLAGVQYDANLHSSTKSKTIDGRWKARRNRGGSQIPPAGAVTVVAAPPIPPPPASVSPQSDDGDDIDVEDDSGEPTGLPAGSAPIGMTTAADFLKFIDKITEGLNASTVTQAKIAEVLTRFSIDSLFSLSARPELIAGVSAAFGFAP